MSVNFMEINLLLEIIVSKMTTILKQIYFSWERLPQTFNKYH
jgi:hypothetical protein